MILKILTGLFVILFLVMGIGWTGLQVKANRFPAYPRESRSLGSVELPADLPEPVARHARAVFGESIPVVESAVVIGRATLRFNGLSLPARFKIYYDAERGYYHYIQATWFGHPVLTVHERFLDGHTILDIPGQFVENDPATDAAANQGFWAEVFVWAPSIFFTDERIQWESIDAHTVRVLIPNAADEEAFVLRFDPASGLMTELSTQRYQGYQDETRLPWTNRVLAWREINGVQVAIKAETQWSDDQPWASWEIEQVILNVDVSDRMNQFGGDYRDK